MVVQEDVSQWLERLRQGDQCAAEAIWEAYFEKLVHLARRRMGALPRRVADEEDVALSAMVSFCQGMRRRRFEGVQDRNGLWRLLVTIVCRKACAQGRRHYSKKRGGRRVRGQSVFAAPLFDGEHDEGLAGFLGKEPTPEMAIEVADECRRMLDGLDESLRPVAQWILEGLGAQEIADRLGCVRRSAERKIRLVHDKLAEWGEAAAADGRPR